MHRLWGYLLMITVLPKKQKQNGKTSALYVVALAASIMGVISSMPFQHLQCCCTIQCQWVTYLSRNKRWSSFGEWVPRHTISAVTEIANNQLHKFTVREARGTRSFEIALGLREEDNWLNLLWWNWDGGAVKLEAVSISQS